MQSIILCGGLGTRLREVIGEKQKTMADVKGTPFLVLLIDFLKKQGIRDFIFACGYKKEEIENYFGDGKKFGIKVDYAIEKEPLGTGGAIRNCLEFIKEEKVFVLNGDTLFEALLMPLIVNMNHFDTQASIIVRQIEDKSRYGTVKIENVDDNGGLIKSFEEKIENEDNSNYINGGIYLMKKSLIQTIEANKKISFEKELMPMWLEQKKKIGAVISNANFIDIGTKESYSIINEK